MTLNDVLAHYANEYEAHGPGPERRTRITYADGSTHEGYITNKHNRIFGTMYEIHHYTTSIGRELQPSSIARIECSTAKHRQSSPVFEKEAQS